MASLEQQLTRLATQLKQLTNTIPIDEQAVGLTLEQHSPGNGSIYTRLRAPKGQTLANGKRTMRLDEKAAADWARKIYARNQRAKVAQCLALIQQATDVAAAITWDFDEPIQLADNSSKFTIDQTEYVPPNPAKAQPKVKAQLKVKAQPKVALKYVFKDATNANPMNRRVHAIATPEPASGRWYAPALCGEQPKAGTWGWITCDPSHLSCPKCYDKVHL